MRFASVFVAALLVSTAPAFAQGAADLYDIALNGTPVTIDGDLSDWDDAQFIFVSQDKVNFLDPNGNPIFNVPDSPADFSGYFAIKADADNMYFAVRVRDEGVPLIDAPNTPNLAFFYDHLSVYMGLYDIGDAAGSPHVEPETEWDFVDPTTNETFDFGDRTYRISPASDNSGTTLGPDYQIYTRALPYGGAVSGDDVQTYHGGYADTTIANTTAATQLFDDETGYVLEWQVPFASLAGTVSNPVRRPQFANIEWPLFTPEDGVVIPFDFDITDLDDASDLNTVVFLRGGDKPALFRDSFNFELRGRFVDQTLRPGVVPGASYFIALDGDAVTVDGDLSDWTDAHFLGFSQDKPNFLDPNGNPIFNVPESPADFSGYFAMKADSENLYFATRVRDEGVPLIDAPNTPNLAFFYDHLSVYMGLFDIGNAAGSPHVEPETEWDFVDPVTNDVFDFGDRTYRIAPGTDNSGTTLGGDYQIYTRALPYGGAVSGDDVQTYHGGYADTTIANTTAATQLFDDETGYNLEWAVPIASLEGQLANPARRPQFVNFAWPEYTPQLGDVIPLDADVTDLDDASDLNTVVFMRMGNKPALFRDSFNFGLRGQFVGDGFVTVGIEETPEFAGPRGTQLAANYPNPFAESTTIEFVVDRASPVTLEVYNMLGQRVATLVDGRAMAPGSYKATFEAAGLSTGVYLARLVTNAGVQTSKMLLAK